MPAIAFRLPPGVATVSAVALTNTVAESLNEPMVAYTFVVPAEMPSTCPLELTVAMAAFADAKVALTGPGVGTPFAFTCCTVSVTDDPIESATLRGEMTMPGPDFGVLSLDDPPDAPFV